ncbi:MAG TPA: hypothetical protein DCX89_00615 [Saprospirales bacterium]|nr:hypothetical protein [Saprospirales bacterium]HRQ30810.1 fibrobacter succinogenes major paralogous domain-containing protein [Saprospiraceae bacterium]
MQDKSNYSNNKPQISEALQNYINAMVEEIVLKGEAFDEQKKKWLRKYSEAEGVNFEELERDFQDLFEALKEYNETGSKSILKFIEIQIHRCFLQPEIIHLLLIKPTSPEVLPELNIKHLKIGNQIWMAENLDLDRFRNGDFIPEACSDEEWNKAFDDKEAVWCYYNYDDSNSQKFGKLYNWFAVTDSRGLAPKGWKIPASNDWEILLAGGRNSVKANREISEKLRSRDGWDVVGNGSQGLDEFGFGMLPAGSRQNGFFYGKNQESFFWSSTQLHPLRSVIYNFHISGMCTLNWPKEYGFSVRCIKE